MSHLLGKKRKFGNDTFTAQASRMKKKDAEKYAENKRKQGMKARVVMAKHPKKGKEYYIFLTKGKPKKKTAKQKHRYGGYPQSYHPAEHYEEEPMPRMRRTEIFDEDVHPMPSRPMPGPTREHDYYRKSKRKTTKKTTKKKTTKKKPVKRKPVKKTTKKKPVKRKPVKKTTKKKPVKRKPVKKTTKKKTKKK
jgi:hypothetical protein